MNSDDVLHQPQHIQHIQQERIISFKAFKPLAMLAAVFIIAVIAGTGGYWLGARNNQSISLLQPTTSVQVATISQVTPTIISNKEDEHIYTPSLYGEGWRFSYPGYWSLKRHDRPETAEVESTFFPNDNGGISPGTNALFK
jgi:hypothetical protein